MKTMKIPRIFLTVFFNEQLALIIPPDPTVQQVKIPAEAYRLTRLLPPALQGMATVFERKRDTPAPSMRLP